MKKFKKPQALLLALFFIIYSSTTYAQDSGESQDCPPCQEWGVAGSHGHECIPVDEGDNPNGEGYCCNGNKVENKLECCKQKGQDSADKSSAGGVTCCDGQPYANPHDDAGKNMSNQKARDAFKKCVKEHEESHKEDCEKRIVVKVKMMELMLVIKIKRINSDQKLKLIKEAVNV